MELLMSSFAMYDRMNRQAVSVPYLRNTFDEAYFIDTVYARAHHMVNSYFFPETAMYMANPDHIMGAFYVRQDDFRVRIDDIQHYVGGYRQFLAQYDRLAEYVN
jgi:hypothetical protein